MARISRLKGFVFSVGLTVASVLLCLLVSETYLTIRYNQEHARIESVSGGREICTRSADSPQLIYTRVPGACDSNAHGYRGPEHDYGKQEGIFRIVIIGDSVAEGHGVAGADTFGQVLERNLNQLTRENAQQVEVIVLAQSGYSTSQELYLLEHEAFRYAPDLVVWSYVLNDPADPVFHNSNGELGSYYFKPFLHTAHFVARKLFEIRERRQGANCDKEYNGFLHCVYWDQVVSNIARIATISQSNHVPLIFLIHPVFEENGDFDNYTLAPLHAKLGATAAAAGLPVVDLLHAYRNYEVAALTLPMAHGFDQLHPNAQGHRIAADYLLDFMLAAGYAPRAPR